MTDIQLFMNLIRYHLHHSAADELPGSAPDDVTIDRLLSLAHRHDLTALLGSVLLENNLISSEPQKLVLQEQMCRAVCYYEIMNDEIQWIQNILEQAKIPHILLKGGIIRRYYPNPWERTSGDIDILIPEEMLDNAVSILCRNGCHRQRDRRYHDIPLKTPGNSLLEMHFSICEDIPALDNVLKKVWEYSTVVPGKCYEYRLSPEYMLFHLLSHMSYHLIHGGCSIRNFIDILLLQRNENLDHQILQQLLFEAKLADFYTQVMAFNGVWFAGNEHSQTTILLEDLVANSQTFGSRDKEILMEQAKAGSRIKYVFQRIFMPYELLIRQYPILKKHPLLLPFCQILRWLRILTGNRKVALREMHSSRSHTGKQIQQTKETLKTIGLNF